ncbi:MAG: GerW family sporulation protein [Cellulosilyticaceae bacterium]
MASQLNDNLGVLLEQLEHFITTKTVVGEPIHIKDTILVPLVDVSFGVAAGATATSKLQEKKKDRERTVDGQSDAGLGGLGARITPSAMLVIQNGTTQLINIKGQDSISKLIDMVPGLVSNIPDLVSKFKTDSENPVDTKEETYHHLEK